MSITKTGLLMTLLRFINLTKSYFTTTTEAQVPRARWAVIAAVGTTPFQLLRPLLEITLVKMRQRMMTIMIRCIRTRQLPLARTREPIVVVNHNSTHSSMASISSLTTTATCYPTAFTQSSLTVILPLAIICIRVTVTPVPKEKDW